MNYIYPDSRETGYCWCMWMELLEWLGIAEYCLGNLTEWQFLAFLFYFRAFVCNLKITQLGWLEGSFSAKDFSGVGKQKEQRIRNIWCLLSWIKMPYSLDKLKDICTYIISFYLLISLEIHRTVLLFPFEGSGKLQCRELQCLESNKVRSRTWLYSRLNSLCPIKKVWVQVKGIGESRSGNVPEPLHGLWNHQFIMTDHFWLCLPKALSI